MNNLNDLLSSKIDSFLGDKKEEVMQHAHDAQQQVQAEESKDDPAATPVQEKPATPAAAPVNLDKIQQYITQIEDLVSLVKAELGGKATTAPIPKTHSPVFAQSQGSSSANTCEGVFNGECMVGSDGKRYPVPPNYASKSKLVEGDMLKVNVTPNGTLIFKQIGPIERDRLIGELALEEDGTFRVICDGRPLRVLTAAITFHKGKPGEQIVILVPKDTPSKWAAVEYIIRD